MSDAPAQLAGTTLIHNVLVFGRLLRSAGFPMSAGREMELLRALELIDLGERARVYQACRAMLVTKRDQLPIFDRAFALFFGRLWDRPPGPVDPDQQQLSQVEPSDELLLPSPFRNVTVRLASVAFGLPTRMYVSKYAPVAPSAWNQLVAASATPADS